MSDRFFIDTNIFVYSFDSRESDKQQKAKELIMEALSTQKGVVSFQVIQEFINVATWKFVHPLSVSDCDKYIEHVFAPMCRLVPSISFYKAALECMQTWKYSWYDSLIITASLKMGCRFLFSEDLQQGQMLQDMEIRNPFV